MKKGVAVIVLLIFLLAVSIAFAAEVDNEVKEKLKQQEEVSVIVVLEDDYNALSEYSASELSKKDDFEKKKEMIVTQQDRVLSKLGYEDVSLENEAAVKRLLKIELLEKTKNDEIDFKLKRKFNSVNGFSGEVTKEGLEKLKNNPDVKRIYFNGVRRITLDVSVPLINATKTWGLVYNEINLTGAGETVCVIDTGVDYNHTNLGGGWGIKIIGGYNTIGGSTNSCSANNSRCFDDHGHGTHVTGIIISNDTAFRGVSPGANIVAIKACDSGGNCADADIINGIDLCTDNAINLNISVISMSLGAGTYSNYCNGDSLAPAINTAVGQNISVVVATGNDNAGQGVISAPACVENATPIGAVNDNDAIQFNRNSLVKILAPGVGITSTQSGGGFIPSSGTSASTPHAGGAFALVRQFLRLYNNSVLAPDSIEDILSNSGKAIADGSDTYRRINIFATILSLDTTAPIITFINPTLANKSNSTNATFFINITSNEVLVNSTLEFNGTNETMEGSGLNWFKNKTLDSGAYLYKVWGADAASNIGLSELRLIQINNTAPNITTFSPLTLDFSINEPNNQTFNISYNDVDGDAVTLFWYKNSTLVSVSNEFNFTGNFTSAGLYNITVFVVDNGDDSQLTWNFEVNNTNQIPTLVSVLVNSTDFLNRTNGTLSGFFTTSDPENDIVTSNETKWYNNTEEVSELVNYTAITSNYTKKSQNWIFSVRVFDGSNWSNWANSSSLTIKNTAPEINITMDTVTINETQKANITTNASDIDNDALTFKINDSARFGLEGIYFVWNTTLADSGTYYVNITVNDTELIDSKIITVIVLDARDLDNDGNPDFNDTDDDNDDISDDNDFLSGNLSSINTTSAISITINGTSNMSQMFNGTFFINITNGTEPIVEFNYTFNSSSTLDLGSITLNRTTNGSSAVSIRGLDLTGMNKTKTLFLEKANTTVAAVCIKDSDAGFNAISSICNGNNEILVNCNNISVNGYACFNTGARYKITGLNHSAVKELCVDSDGDKYGTGCSLGSDCDDNDAIKNTDCSSGNGGSSGGGSSGGGGGGGGGGGSGASYTCNMDWSCTDWSECDGKWQTRECSFVKVAQHTQKEPCPSIKNVPEMAKKCEIKKVESKPIKIPINETEKAEPKAMASITGAATAEVKEKRSNILVGITITILIVVVGVLFYTKFFRYK